MLAAGCPVVGREMLATGFPNDWLDQTMSHQLIQTTSFAMHPRLLVFSHQLIFLHLLIHDVVTDDIIIDGPLRCSSWFPFDVPAGPSSSSSACSWILSFQLVHYVPAGSTWLLPDYEQLTQLWTSSLLIQLPFTMINQTSC
ncbi:serine/threonine-protein kinase TOR-like [Dorcoceras hygrometricum]|uniref:Serine/threonine-protein kinase TOR-like n=1 Tax=Dorcoceras hygrometricum TaxID=472368 RepID=A0A2Z7CWU2_9LAMI|nr:serine/threonine-protein kinase TOR-like [Dorcoceras hygrometricum]